MSCPPAGPGWRTSCGPSPGRGRGWRRSTCSAANAGPGAPSPSRASTLAHGFATISKFFPGTKEASAWLEERLFAAVVGEHAGGAPLVFDDEYISSGGQLYELLVGHDRFIADLRPVLMRRPLPGARRPAPPAPARAGSAPAPTTSAPPASPPRAGSR